MDRKLNALFLFLLVVVFISAASISQQWNILLGLIFSAAFSFLAFVFHRLTLDGMFAAIVIGTFVFGLGGWGATAIVLLFFITSAIISGQWQHKYVDLPTNARRDGLQVWANGFWLICCLVLAVIFDTNIFLIGAMAVVATATADTWATELGSTAPDATYLITSFKKVSPGTDGGVSLKGTTTAIVASALIAAATIYVFSLDFFVFINIFMAGFLGCLVDSYLGAIFQRNNSSVMIPVLELSISIDNNLVNGIATGAGALLAITLSLLVA
jgi:uncharacterized protein (TIGR00297 family)